MNESRINSLIAESSPILQDFLGTLLNQEAAFEIGSPEASTSEALKAETVTKFTAVTKSDGPHAFAIQFEPVWVMPVSSAMLGNEMDPTDNGAGDLISEIVTQAYGSLRNMLPVAGQLPDAYFDVLVPSQEIPGGRLADTLWKIPLAATLGEQTLKAALFLSEATINYLGDLMDTSEQEPEMAPSHEAAPAPVSDPVDVAAPQFQDLGREHLIKESPGNFDLLAEVELTLTVELGRRKLALSEVLQLTPGSVIELEKLVGEPLEIYANGRLIAEGEAVVVDEQFGVRITNLAPAKIRSKAAA